MRYVARKLGFYLVAAWVALTINFLLPQLIPGNPVEALIGRMSQSGTVPPGEARVLTALLGLGGGNIAEKYWQYLDGLVHLQFGLSIANFPTPVATEISQSIYWTLILVGTATVISFALGIALGALAGWKRGSRLDGIIPATTLLTAMPYFWLALIMLYAVRHQRLARAAAGSGVRHQLRAQPGRGTSRSWPPPCSTPSCPR